MNKFTYFKYIEIIIEEEKIIDMLDEYDYIFIELIDRKEKKYD